MWHVPFLNEDIILCIGYRLKVKSCQRNNEDKCGISTQIFHCSLGGTF